ncbi:Flp family type IVb pilin [Lentibacillus juripiscarius]|uniref:Flp family type IVb pilin n=1 Tax=Lentibacillus juripiscarius TaxID=257446 RepID=A0ABW5V5I7_9BACI
MKFVNGIYAKAMSKIEELKKDESGSQTLEWIGIAAVIVILVGVVSQAFSGGDFGDTLVQKFNDLITQIGSGG